MIDYPNTEKMARRIRDAAGEHNDPDEPVDYVVRNMVNTIATLRREVEELKAERRWIPVSEPPADFDEALLVCFHHIENGGEDRYALVLDWTDVIHWDGQDRPIGWRKIGPLPQPPAAPSRTPGRPPSILLAGREGPRR